MESQNYIQLYGGLLAEAPVSGHESTVFDSTENPKPRKTTRKRSPRSEDDAKQARARGRPRLDPQDQSAAERRRTQIRLAQRAYRERKETTIAALERRVHELESTIANMSKTFQEYNDKATAVGLSQWGSPMGDDLKKTANLFWAFARDGIHDLEMEDQHDEQDKSSERSSDPPSERTPSYGSARFAGDEITSSLNEDATSVDANTTPGEMLGYEMSYDDISNDPTFDDNPHQRATETFQTHKLPKSNDQGDLTHQIPQLQPSLEISPKATEAEMQINAMNPGITSPYTYSFQESTFARRLTRASYERGYYLLTNPNTPKPLLHRLFRFSFCYSNIDRMRERLQTILKRSNQESLDCWDTPQRNLGGAGTHFPRNETRPDGFLAQDWRVPQVFGPRPVIQPETRIDDDSIVNVTRKLGMEGQFFDANDVEQYLKMKGLNLDGHSSLAEIEVEGDVIMEPLSSPESPSTNDSHDPPSPQAAGVVSPAFFAPNGDYFTSEARSPTTADQQFNFDDNLTDFTGTWNATGELKGIEAIGQQQDLFADPSLSLQDIGLQFQAPPKKKLTIDVDKLLAMINRGAMCIGRSPGYRQESVDKALVTALHEAF